MATEVDVRLPSLAVLLYNDPRRKTSLELMFSSVLYMHFCSDWSFEPVQGLVLFKSKTACAALEAELVPCVGAEATVAEFKSEVD